jgi:cell division protein FtsZ
VLRHGVQAIAEVITVPGMINLDFADVKAVMKDAGPAWMSVGRGTGQNRAVNSAKEALASPLLDVSVEKAKGVLFNVAGGSSLTLFEVNEAADTISKAVDPDANIIFGVVYDPQLDEEMKITLIATGFVPKVGMVPPKEDELRQLLKGIQSEHDLDVPSFLRKPASWRRRQTLIPSTAEETPSQLPLR